MPIADIVIAIAIVISIGVGVFRGFVKEAISIVTLLVAVWAAMNFGAYAGQWSESWVSSEGLQLWFGRVLIFVVILTVGGLIGWGVARLVRLSALNGTNRALGAMFGFCRGAILLGVFIIGGQLASFDQDDWWRSSKLIPYGTAVADWIRVMAPKGVDLLRQEEMPGQPLDDKAGLNSAIGGIP
jgi:membrane protein required for colicin V production